MEINEKELNMTELEEAAGGIDHQSGGGKGSIIEWFVGLFDGLFD